MERKESYDGAVSQNKKKKWKRKRKLMKRKRWGSMKTKKNLLRKTKQKKEELKGAVLIRRVETIQRKGRETQNKLSRKETQRQRRKQGKGKKQSEQK